jgi:aspartate-semialdehyde dehydrogenase
MTKIPVGVVGATGLAGQQFLVTLLGHPMFEVTRLAASSRSAGKTYRDALRESSGQIRWYAGGDRDAVFAAFGDLPVEDAQAFSAKGLGVVFSAIEAEPARELEPRWAADTAVVSTASAYRYEDDVPILVPGVNGDHAKLLDAQRKRRGWKGFITPNPNCTTTGLVITLAPLARAFGVVRVLMTSLQACSGAGRSPGVIGLDIIDNIIPYIPKEEEKVERETRKILGALENDAIIPAPLAMSATCTRVPVIEGHTEAVYVELGRPVEEAEIREVWRSAGQDIAQLPSAPRELIHLSDDPFRPQVRLDRDREDGMSTVVGRLRKDGALANGWKYILVSHNTKMGAAKGAVLSAELLHRDGYIKV